MELFSLLAKLTLDTSEYESSLRKAESLGQSADDVEASLSLDTSEFDQAIEDANEAKVDDPDSPELDLDDEPFQGVVSDAENVEVDDPDSPELDLDAQPLKDSLAEVQDQDLPTFEQSVGQTIEGIKGLIAGAGIAAAIAGVVSSLSEAVDLARSMGDNIDKSSRAMSISTDAYQEWSHVLDINGASITDLNRGLMNMRKMMGGGEASKEFSEAMDRLGLSAKVANGEIASTEELLSAAMKTLADFSGDAADRDYLAQAIFGRGGTKLNAMFDGTSKDIDALIQQAHDLGLVMTEEEVANAASYNDAVTNMHASLDALKTSLATEILPILTNVFNQAAKIFAVFNWRTGDDDLSGMFKEIDEKGADALVTIQENKTEAMALIDKLASMGDYWTLDDNGKKTFDQLAAELIKLYPELDKVISDNKNAIGENTEAIKANIDEWTKLEQQRILSQNLADKRTAIAERYAAVLDKEIEADVKEAEAEGKKATAIEAVNEILKKNEDLRNAIQGRWGTTTLNEENAADILKWIQDQSFLTTGMDSVEEFNKLNVEAQALREEASKMEEEANTASQSYTEYADALAKKLGIAISDTQTATTEAGNLKTALGEIPNEKHVKISIDEVTAFPHAKGAWSIPYDNYPALLHRGERVLTASQARQDNYQGEQSVDATTLFKGVVGAIREGMDGAQVNSYLDSGAINRHINDVTGQTLMARRFA